MKLKNDEKTLIMGILNITPDSFSDGGKFLLPEDAKIQAEKLIAAGADIIDIGAESTRPGFTPVSVEEEISRLERILPAVAELKIPVSVDTYKAEVARYALKSGAQIINDIQGLQFDGGNMAKVAAEFDAPVIVMHNRTKNFVPSEDIVGEIKNYFRRSIEIAEKAGCNTSKMIFDPGIGFGKTQEENLEILRRIGELKILGGEKIPLLLGASRKSFIGYAIGLDVENRDEATGAICIFGILNGVDIVRVHNVEMISKMCKMIDALRIPKIDRRRQCT